jgi:hypothetical protein
MAGITGQGTSYNLPNYHGDLFVVSPTDTPFLSAIGGLAGAKKTRATEFEWQTTDRRSSSANNVALEGANAPTAAERTRGNVSNLVEIHHSAIDVSYTAQAARAQMAGVNIGVDDNPVQDELAFQTQAELESMAVDVENSFLTGVYQKPVDNTTARKTRGVLTAITTNVNANGGTARPLTKAIVDSTLQTAYQNGARLPQDKTVFMVGPAQKVALSNLYSTPNLNQPTFTRNIGGVAIDTLVTDFGVFGIMINRWMPAGKIGIVDLSVCQPVFLEIPGKGLLFVEPLGKVGSSTRYQLYGEIGLEYGPERYHARIDDLV